MKVHNMKACVTGFGIVDALGFTPTQCYENYMSDKDFIQHLESDTPINRAFIVDEKACEYPPGVKIPPLSRSARLSLHAVKHAISSAGVSPSENVGVFFSHGALGEIDHEFHTGKRLSPRRVISGLVGSIPSLISQTYGFRGINTGTSAACATGLITIDYAMRFLDEYDYVVVGAADCLSSKHGALLFNQIGALANHSTPFDNGRAGFVLGDGAGCLILESYEKAVARGAKIHAILHKPGISNDTSSDTSPDPDGRGAKDAMRKALANSGFEDVDAVNAHATSTVIGDIIEYNAIRSITNAPIYSCKGKMGHTINASGIIETIYTIMFASNKHIGYTFNLKDPLSADPGLVTEPVYLDNIVTLNNSFGFGGRCVSQVIEVSNDH